MTFSDSSLPKCRTNLFQYSWTSWTLQSHVHTFFKIQNWTVPSSQLKSAKVINILRVRDHNYRFLG